MVTPSFVSEIELDIDQRQQHVLDVRLDTARQVYNAVLGESLFRLRMMRNSPEYQDARNMPKGKKRTKAFAAVRERFGVREYDLHAYAKQFNHGWLGEHLDINTIQKMASRAYRAVNEYAMGKCGRPRFKGINRMNSVEGKTNKSGIRFKDGAVHWLGEVFPLIVPDSDDVIAHGLQGKVKYVRIVRRRLRGRNRYYVQLVCEGVPFQKPKNVTQSGIVGLDIGPSTVAIVAPDVEYASLEMFCDAIDNLEKEIAKLQRQIERQRRAANPDNYHPDRWVKNKDGNWKLQKGKIKKGRHKWVRSERMKANQERLRTLQHKLAAHRKSLHGNMVNRILAMGTTVKIEKLSYKAFQRIWGKSAGKRAPGTFVAHLRRKAASAGGGVDEFSTYHTRLSQTCHNCGTVAKKTLNERWHNCACGLCQQRDLYSAFLATCVEDNRLVAGIAKDSYAGIDNTLRAAASRNKSVIGQHPPPAFYVGSQNGSPANVLDCMGKAYGIGHPPPTMREPAAFRTPRL